MCHVVQANFTPDCLREIPWLIIMFQFLFCLMIVLFQLIKRILSDAINVVLRYVKPHYHCLGQVDIAKGAKWPGQCTRNFIH